MRKLSYKMIQWLDLNFKGYSDPTESLTTFAGEFNMSLDEANDLFKVWLRVEDHRNWYEDLEDEEECTEDGGSWSG